MHAPIIIFTYNRLSHLKKLLFSLKKNSDLDMLVVGIYRPKDKKDKIKTDKIFDYLHSLTLHHIHTYIPHIK